jgi:hypothetical protein
MSYSTMEKLQYGGSRAQESRHPASTCSVRVGQCVHTYLHTCALRMCTAVYRASVRFCLTNFPAAHSVRSLPRLRGRGREGACNKVQGHATKSTPHAKRFMCARSPPPHPSPASGGGSRPVSLLALVPPRTNMRSLRVRRFFAGTSGGKAGLARVDPGRPAAIKYLTVPPGEAAHFVSADCRLVDE